MFILLLVCTGQQVGGNALISTYSTYFFQLAGLADPFTATMIQNCVALIAIIFYFVVIDRVGRRLPTCTVYAILTVALWIIGGLYYIPSSGAQSALVSQSYVRANRSLRSSASGSHVSPYTPHRTTLLRLSFLLCS